MVRWCQFFKSVETTFTINIVFGLHWLADPLKRVVAGWVGDLLNVDSIAHMTNELFEGIFFGVEDFGKDGLVSLFRLLL